MATIAVAEVEIIPSFRGGQAALARELGGTKAGELAGKEVAAGLVPQVAVAGAKAGEEFAAGLGPALAEGGKAGGVKAGEELRVGILEGGRGLGPALAEETAAAGAEAGTAAGAEAGEKFGAKFLEFAKELAAPLLAFFAVEKVEEFAKSSVEAAETAEKTSKLIELQVERTGAAAGVSLKTIDDLETSIGESAGRSKEQVAESEQALLRFSSVANKPGAGNDIFTRASNDAADLAVIMKTDLPTAAATLGKALNNPGQGLARLTRAGVYFTKEQTAQITAMTASGNKLGAQTIILDQFEKKYGGAAAAGATAADHFKASTDNLRQSLGEKLLPVVANVEDGLAHFGTKVEGVITALGEHNDTDLAKALGVPPGSTVVQDLDNVRDSLTTMVGQIKDALPAALPALKELGTDLAELAALNLSTELKALGDLATAIGAVAGGYDKIDKATHGYLFQALSGQKGIQLTGQALGFLSGHFGDVVHGIQSAGYALNTFTGGPTAKATAATTKFTTVTAAQNKVIAASGPVFNDYLTGLGLSTTASGKASTAADDLGGKVSLLQHPFAAVSVTAKQAGLDTDAYGKASKTADQGLSQLNTDLSNLGQQYFGIANASDAFRGSLNAIVEAIKGSKQGINGYSDAAIAARQAVRTSVGDVGGALAADEKAHESASKIMDDYYAKRGLLVKTLQQEGLTPKQIKVYTDALSHVPAVIHSQAELDTKKATALSGVFHDKLVRSVPKTVQTRINLKAPNAAETDALIFKMEKPIPKSIEIRLALNSAAYEKKLQTLEKAGASPIFAAQGLKNQATLPHFATGGPILGAGGPTSDSVLAAVSTGEDVVNADAYARNRALVNAINSGGPLPSTGGAAPVTHTHVRVFLGTRELTDLVRTEIDSTDTATATYLRGHPAMAG